MTPAPPPAPSSLVVVVRLRAGARGRDRGRGGAGRRGCLSGLGRTGLAQAVAPPPAWTLRRALDRKAPDPGGALVQRHTGGGRRLSRVVPQTSLELGEELLQRLLGRRRSPRGRLVFSLVVRSARLAFHAERIIGVWLVSNGDAI